ncbi:MAG TPA: glycosyltransferase [Stellaceae bacterium]|nr:glycosyltransferase [Stellaceae bacterium]
MSPRVLFHVQHLLGIGHARRAAMLAAAMRREGLDVTVLSGGEPLDLDWGGARIVQLPWARARDQSFKPLVDADNRPIDDAFHANRRRLVLDAFARAAPQALLIESYPFARRAFRTELDALIAAARARQPAAAVLGSIRDILVAKDNPARSAEIVAQVRRDFDAVLVHGDPALVPLEASFPAAAEIADRLRYTGYVAAAAPAREAADTGEVLVSAGGGAVGLPLLKAALAARPRSALADRRWRLITGPNLPAADFAALAAACPSGVMLERFRPDFPALLAGCHLSVSQGGYNTLLDVLQARRRAVVVPFARGGETEQRLRAQLLAARALIHLVDEDDLDRPEAGAGLAAAIAAALAAPPPPALGLALDGARRSALAVAEMARQRLAA